MSIFEKAAPVMTYGGGTTTVLFSFSWNEIGVIVGILIGLIGLILQWYYKAREDVRSQTLFDLQILDHNRKSEFLNAANRK